MTGRAKMNSEMKQSISGLKKDLFESFFEAHLAAENRDFFNEENKEAVEAWFNSGFENRDGRLKEFFYLYLLLPRAKVLPDSQEFDFDFAKYCWENGWYATKPERIYEVPNPLGFVLQFYGQVKNASNS